MQCSYNLLWSALNISILGKPIHALHAEPVSACGLDKANSLRELAQFGHRPHMDYAIAKTNREKCVLANRLQFCDRTLYEIEKNFKYKKCAKLHSPLTFFVKTKIRQTAETPELKMQTRYKIEKKQPPSLMVTILKTVGEN